MSKYLLVACILHLVPTCTNHLIYSYLGRAFESAAILLQHAKLALCYPFDLDNFQHVPNLNSEFKVTTVSEKSNWIQILQRTSSLVLTPGGLAALTTCPSHLGRSTTVWAWKHQGMDGDGSAVTLWPMKYRIFLGEGMNSPWFTAMRNAIYRICVVKKRVRYMYLYVLLSWPTMSARFQLAASAQHTYSSYPNPEAPKTLNWYPWKSVKKWLSRSSWYWDMSYP